jgi:hypothetical protein
MRKAIIALAIVMGAMAFTAPADAHKTKKPHKHATAKKYTCPMHPEVVSSKPGKCPKCGMKLELVKADKKK